MTTISQSRTSIDVEVTGQWLEALDLISGDEETGSLPDLLSDGTILCRLANRIKPGSIENIDFSKSYQASQANIQKFKNACRILKIKSNFDVVDFTEQGDFDLVFETLKGLYDLASDFGMGKEFTHHLSKKKSSPLSSSSSIGSHQTISTQVTSTEELDSGTSRHIVKAIYDFKGSDQDELTFSIGDLITVTKVVDGGWWEGACNGHNGWFPGNHVTELSAEEAEASRKELASNKGDSVQLYYNLVVQNIVDSERTYVQELRTVLHTYLNPLKTADVLAVEDVLKLMGNLNDLFVFQDKFFSAVANCAKLSISKQSIGQLFLSHLEELTKLYRTYVANHPRAVAILTDNSDKLSEYMESKGASSPGMFTLTISLSKPMRRLEKYPQEIMELSRQMPDGHPDKESVNKAHQAYDSLMLETQELRKKKEMEFEMVSSPVEGWPGKNLMELGECSAMVQANHLTSTGEVSDRYYLVFSGVLVVLCAGQNLNGYELKANYALSTAQVRHGNASADWPNAVEIHLPHKLVVRASLHSEADLEKFLSAIEASSSSQPISRLTPRNRLGSGSSVSMVPRKGSRMSIPGPRSASRFNRKNTPITRKLHWGFKSLQIAPPLTPKQLQALKEMDKSPKQLRKFIYVGSRKRRQSKADEQMKGDIKKMAEHDGQLLRVIESYCQLGKTELPESEGEKVVSLTRAASDSRPRPGLLSKYGNQSFDEASSDRDGNRKQRALKMTISSPITGQIPPSLRRPK